MTFAFPLLVGNLIQQVYNLTDSVIVRRFLGKEVAPVFDIPLDGEGEAAVYVLARNFWKISFRHPGRDDVFL